MYGLLGQYLAEMQLFENMESEDENKEKKVAFKVEMKFLAMHIINNQKLSCDIFTVGNLEKCLHRT